MLWFFFHGFLFGFFFFLLSLLARSGHGMTLGLGFPTLREEDGRKESLAIEEAESLHLGHSTSRDGLVALVGWLVR